MIERLHPDADSLNAFIEGVLPEHERLQCLAHLAECDRCREVVFVAQAPLAAPRSTPIRRRWFAPIPVLGAAAAACLVVAAVWIYLHRTPAPPPHEIASRVTPVQPVPVSPPPIQEKIQAPSSSTPRTKRESHSAPQRRSFNAGIKLPPPAPMEPPSLPPPPSISFDVPGETARGVLPLPKAAQPSAQGRLSGITGTVIDPSGATIPGATVTLHQLAGTSTTNAETDRTGMFKMTELPAGKYELQITATGFQRTSMQIDLPPQEVAVVTPTLSIGSSAQTVEVVAANTVVSTESASIVAEPRPLPSKLPVDTTVASGKLLLALDSDGTLFLSRNKGKSWKSVKPVWQGKVVELSKPDPPSTAAFQLTTGSGAHWLSRDGSHWYPTH